MARLAIMGLFAGGLLVGGLLAGALLGPSLHTPEPTQADAPASEPLSPEQRDVQERELSERRAAQIRAAAAREDVDPGWATTMERQIADSFAAHAPPQSRLLSASCKTTLCVVEVELSAQFADSTTLDWPRLLQLSRGFIVHHDPGPDGYRRTIAFLARDGHSLPTPTRLP